MESPQALPSFNANRSPICVVCKPTPRLVRGVLFCVVVTDGLRRCAANPAYRLKRIDKSTALMSLVSVPSEM